MGCSLQWVQSFSDTGWKDFTTMYMWSNTALYTWNLWMAYMLCVLYHNKVSYSLSLLTLGTHFFKSFIFVVFEDRIFSEVQHKFNLFFHDLSGYHPPSQCQSHPRNTLIYSSSKFEICYYPTQIKLSRHKRDVVKTDFWKLYNYKCKPRPTI